MSGFDNYLKRKQENEIKDSISKLFPHFNLDTTSDELLDKMLDFVSSQKKHEDEMLKYRKDMETLRRDIDLKRISLESNISSEKGLISTIGKSEFERRQIDAKNDEIKSENSKIASNNYNIKIQMLELEKMYLDEMEKRPVKQNLLSFENLTLSRLNEVERQEVHEMIEFQQKKLGVVNKCNDLFEEGYVKAKVVYEKNNPSVHEQVESKYGKKTYKWVFESDKRNLVKGLLRYGGSINFNYYTMLVCSCFAFIMGLFLGFDKIFSENLLTSLLLGQLVVGLVMYPIALWGLSEVYKAIVKTIEEEVYTKHDSEGNYASFAYVSFIQQPYLDELSKVENNVNRKLVSKYEYFFDSFDILSCDYSIGYLINESDPILNDSHSDIDYSDFINLVEDFYTKR
jgi:hypothetical protein